METLLEIAAVVVSVIGLVWCGIFVGREFGTFENFSVAVVNKLIEKLSEQD